MTSFKKYASLFIAFLLGITITYLWMSLEMVKHDLKSKASVAELEADNKYLKKQLNPEKEQQEEKYWFDDRVEQQAVDSEKRTKEQQSEGNDLKSQFDQFAE